MDDRQSLPPESCDAGDRREPLVKSGPVSESGVFAPVGQDWTLLARDAGYQVPPQP